MNRHSGGIRRRTITPIVCVLALALVTVGWLGWNRPGSADVTDYEVVYHPYNRTFPDGVEDFISASCPEGKKALGGGFASAEGDSGMGVFASYPINGGDVWSVGLTPTTDQSAVTVAVICAVVS